MKSDFILAGDTDSQLVGLYEYISKIEFKDKFDNLSNDKKIKFLLLMIKEIEEKLNKRCFEELQLQNYNSNEKDYKIEYEQEVIAETGIFLAKKKYVLNIINEKGISKDEIFARGVEIIRSDTPEQIKPKLKEVLKDILKKVPDNELADKIIKIKNELKLLIPEEIAINISINKVKEYIDENGNPRKGTPMHIKGAINFEKLRKEFKLEDKIEELEVGGKVKVVYLQPNKYNMESLAFRRWPVEFTKNNIKVDYSKMIDKYFLRKIDMFLSVMNKSQLLNENNKFLEELFC